MLKSFIYESSKCLNKYCEISNFQNFDIFPKRFSFLPKQLCFVSLKKHTTISYYNDIDRYKSVFMNYSTTVSNPKDYMKKIIEIQRHEKISPYIFFVKEQLKLDNYHGIYKLIKKEKKVL